MRLWLVLWLGLAACRIGFDDLEAPDEPNGPSASVRVTVLGATGEARAGQPIADAFVVITAPSGETETLRTADDGQAVAEILQGTDVHIARPAPELAASRWLLYSFHAIESDRDLIVGSRPPAAVAPLAMTANLPAFPGAAFTHSRVRGPLRCVPDAAPTLGTTVAFEIAASCIGASVPLVAQGLENKPYAYILLGDTPLEDGGVIAPPTGWKDADKYDVEYAGLPAAITEVYGFVALPGPSSSSADAIIVDDDIDTPVTGVAALYYDGPPLVDGALIGTALFDESGGSRLIVERVDTGFGNRLFDNELVGVAVSLPIADPTAQTIAWSAEQDPAIDIAAVQTMIEANDLEIVWRAYGPGSARSLVFPMLPAALATLAPDAAATWTPDSVALVALSDLTYATIMPVIDRDLTHWLEGAAHLPPGSFTVSVAEPPANARIGAIPSLVDRVKRSLGR